jgi:hypothetical protein
MDNVALDAKVRADIAHGNAEKFFKLDKARTST